MSENLDLLLPDSGRFIVTRGEGAEQRWWTRPRGHIKFGRWVERAKAHIYTSRMYARAIADIWEGARVEELAR